MSKVLVLLYVCINSIIEPKRDLKKERNRERERERDREREKERRRTTEGERKIER